jgi:PBSX family phage portal protein
MSETTIKVPRTTSGARESGLLKAAGEGHEMRSDTIVPVRKSERPAATNANEKPASDDRESIDTIEPPIDMQWLVSLIDDSDELKQCIRAVVQGTTSYGYRLIPDFDQQKIPKDLEEEVANEKAAVSTFLEWAGSSHSFSEILERCEEDKQTVGQFYMEIVRYDGPFPENRIASIEHVVASQIRHGLVSKTPVHVETRYRKRLPDGRIELATRKDPKMLRRYVQESTTTYSGIGTVDRVWYKSFGDPRSYDRGTGEEITDSEEIKKAAKNLTLAHELIHVANYNPSGSSYGKPVFVGCLYAIVGSRQAEKINHATFKNNLVPSYVVMVSGGALTDGSVKRIETYIETSLKGNDNWSRFVVLEAESFFQDDVGATVKMDIKPLADLQHSEGMFSGFRGECRDSVRASFRMPAILVGRSQDWSGPVINGARRLVDETVYSPERQVIDRLVNRLILTSLGIKYVRFESNTPNTTDNIDLVTLLNNAEKTGGVNPMIARMIMERVLGVPLGDFPTGFDATVPFSLTMAEAVKNMADPTEPGQQVTAIKRLLGVPVVASKSDDDRS